MSLLSLWLKCQLYHWIVDHYFLLPIIMLFLLILLNLLELIIS